MNERASTGSRIDTLVRRLGVILLVVSTAMVSLAMPAPTTACVCIETDAGDVVITGKLIDSPGAGIVEFVGMRGVYTFDVEGVSRGDAGDGRVFTPPGYGSCGSHFELGARYEVHADVVDPDEPWWSYGRPHASLATMRCMPGSLVDPAPPLGFLVSPSAHRPLAAVAAVLVGLCGVWWLRRSRRGN